MLGLSGFKVDIGLITQEDGYDFKVSLSGFFYWKKGEKMILIVFKRSRSPS